MNNLDNLLDVLNIAQTDDLEILDMKLLFQP
jgi:hypothetical protein